MEHKAILSLALDHRTKPSSSKRALLNNHRRRKPQAVPAVDKVESWLLTSFENDPNATPTTLDSAINRLIDSSPLRSLPAEVPDHDDDDSSVDTTRYIKSNRTVTRLQKRDVTIRKYSKLCTSPTPRLLPKQYLARNCKNDPNVQPETTVVPPVVAKRKRLLKYSSSMNLRVKRMNRVGGGISSSSSSEAETTGPDERTVRKKTMLAKKRVRHESI